MWWSINETEINLSKISIKQNEMKCILMWWCTDETEINLNHIWVRFK